MTVTYLMASRSKEKLNLSHDDKMEHSPWCTVAEFRFFPEPVFHIPVSGCKKERHEILKSGLKDIIGQFVYVLMIIYRDLS